jgi:hypothetical protein
VPLSSAENKDLPEWGLLLSISQLPLASRLVVLFNVFGNTGEIRSFGQGWGICSG